MDEQVRRAVERLAFTHTMHLEGREYGCVALVAQLRDAICSSLGAGSGGGSGDGGLLNHGAMSLYEHIDGTVRGWMQSLGKPHRGDLELVLAALPAVVQAAHVAGEVDDDLADRLYAMFGQWVAQIEDLFDPPHEMELLAACPECEVEYVTNTYYDGNDRIEDMTQRRAVVIPVKRGRAIVAECRACNAMWAGEESLLELAEGMQIEVDFVALREYANAPSDD